MTAPLHVFVGYDTREDDAYRVCKHSLISRASIPVNVIPLKQRELRRLGAYDRPHSVGANGQMIDERDGRPFSTEFTFTRFLTPSLARALGDKGWAIFCDCDFLWLSDVKNLVDLTDPRYALMCVKHDHRPVEQTKMDNQQQATYSRKNWSSLMLFNLSHASNLELTNHDVNHKPGRWLHGMRWLEDYEIGGVPEQWNWLEGYSSNLVTPSVVHFTRGGPWFENYQDVEYADEWLAEKAKLDARVEKTA